MKKFIAIALIAMMAVAFSSCGNMDMWDTNYTFDTALVRMPDDSVLEIKIKQWTDYEDGEQLQITAEDGTVYLVSANNTVLINEKEK